MSKLGGPEVAVPLTSALEALMQRHVTNGIERVVVVEGEEIEYVGAEFRPNIYGDDEL